ncbi:MAG: type II toxin-antitoxin system VapC family toxin [Alphaproteobacteria bacterium]|nr:type II toxin-antitoxin system VapC family toxin [Alphaproteobacteria bacterium]
MTVLVDTHLLLWAAGEPEKLSPTARALLQAPDQELLFSAASLWEVAIKHGLGREDFRVEPRKLRRGLIENGWRELAMTSEHAIAAAELPPLHKDPFDRMMLAQAHVEGVTLLTSDDVVAKYPGQVRKV